ncbi:MAG: hypothetical protein WC730_02330 [Patescibacteria group bacterium]
MELVASIAPNVRLSTDRRPSSKLYWVESSTGPLTELANLTEVVCIIMQRRCHTHPADPANMIVIPGGATPLMFTKKGKIPEERRIPARLHFGVAWALCYFHTQYGIAGYLEIIRSY